MQCEICGNDIKGSPVRVTVEGTVLDVCGKCARYGRPADKWSPVSRKMAPVERVIVTRRPRRDVFDKLQDEIVPDYARIIKQARESHGLTVEELASRIMEKSALIRKIEREELVPEDTVRKKLETELNIKLTEKISMHDQRGGGFIRETTLGDVAIIRKKSK
ncbi:MAG: multiprotein bridging factor aMBF1 [Candidatus Methanoperedens sp.]|nr:multiprotein bridging factor aMBF1 [Candidatus Methanoperedens sp.]MCZ7358473.1 multiprotein bridging factor aMBF1 [Candidatus Methanoperedens sp.]HLB69960.1 multiprotein bridging factor aMBF1 [Candidatus Methanoperedens sp.]